MGLQFENDVNMYGTQAPLLCVLSEALFENDVNMYGTQAKSIIPAPTDAFENDVNMYGTQAGGNPRPSNCPV